MKKKLKLMHSIMTLAVIAMVSPVSGQTFSVPLEGFSKKKISKLHMADGSISEGYLSGFKRSKGLIEEVKMKNEKGKKVKISPEDITFMYLPPSNLAKLGAALDKMQNANKWEKETNIDTTLMNEGYVYFELSLTQIKKKQKNLMLQLMNTSFSEKAKIYHDPFAKETASIGIGGVALAGGLDKSYYIRLHNKKVATRILKKNYKEEFTTLFSDCPDLVTKYKENIKWSDFETHVYEYNTIMKGK